MIKYISIAGTTLAMLSLQPLLTVGESTEEAAAPALYGDVLAPYVTIQQSDKFMQPTLCKVKDAKAPILEQLEQCKKQRVGWLKI